ncbi:MAG: tetratricopeptide repeat protein [Methanobacteriota archaeon]|nr:MAG: tetratricopeptide repeat protein [Euryarchaeota archaeon]
MVLQVYCPKCGESVPDDAEFCMKCGQRIGQPAEEKSPGSKEAEKWLSKARALKEEGIAKDDRGKIEESLSAFDKAIDKDPRNAALWYEKGVALGLLERFEEALENFETALKLDPGNEDYKAMRDNARESIAARQKKEEAPKKKEMPSIAMEIKAAVKELDEAKVIKTIDSLMGRQEYHTLKALEEDAVERLKKEGYKLGEKELQLVKDMVIKHGHTGKFAIDDMIARKLGGGKKAAMIVTVVLVILGAVVTEILIPMMGEKLMNEPPVAQITSPEDNIVLTSGQTVVFKADAKDKEDGENILGSNFVWSSSIDGELGRGRSISVSTLSPGTHTITLTVTDSKGAEDTESLVLTIQERKILHELKLPKRVNVNGKEEDAFIRVWEPLIDEKAPDKGWLEMETPFYSIKVNLDHSYYLLYDKVLGKDLLVYNDRVENPTDMLTGSDLGFADQEGNNKIQWGTTALHDPNGIGRYQILFEDRDAGFLLVDTEGWDIPGSGDPTEGFDAEAEVMFGLFADKPYFINADEFNNLQKLGLKQYSDEHLRQLRSPNEVVQTWVITGEYDYATIKGGDSDHLNGVMWAPWYEVNPIFGERKAWHAGSASISKQFPDHRLIGNKLGGAMIFSLPQGYFRWDDSKDVFGGQVVSEFLIIVEKPEKAVGFAVEPVNQLTFLYDSKDYATIEGYPESMTAICSRYGLSCIGTLDATDWDTKRFAYVITLTQDWYDARTNTVKEDTWSLADQGLADFHSYEDVILTQMKSTKPLISY